jgi:hypothetical protein
MSDHLLKSDGAPSNPPQNVRPEADRPRAVASRPVEHGGRRADVSGGLEPTRYGDWEKDGRCIDF